MIPTPLCLEYRQMKFGVAKAVYWRVVKKSFLCGAADDLARETDPALAVDDDDDDDGNKTRKEGPEYICTSRTGNEERRPERERLGKERQGVPDCRSQSQLAL